MDWMLLQQQMYRQKLVYNHLLWQNEQDFQYHNIKRSLNYNFSRKEIAKNMKAMIILFSRKTRTVYRSYQSLLMLNCSAFNIGFYDKHICKACTPANCCSYYGERELLLILMLEQCTLVWVLSLGKRLYIV